MKCNLVPFGHYLEHHCVKNTQPIAYKIFESENMYLKVYLVKSQYVWFLIKIFLVLLFLLGTFYDSEMV